MILPTIPPPRLLPRDPAAHKGSAGHVLVIGGSKGMSGAPRLAGRAALLTGAGLVSVAVPEPVRAEIAATEPTMMVHGVRSTLDGGLSSRALREIRALLERKSALVLGPGLGRTEEAGILARQLAMEAAIPVVLDADALFALAHGPPIAAVAVRILTPHEAEAARLLGVTVAEVRADRPSAARRLAERHRAMVVLKGPGTLVASAGGIARNPTGNPGLAVAGSGDVLAGMIAAFLAQGMEASEAALAAVYLHGVAADRLILTHGERAQTPDALLAILPSVLRDHESRRS